jgi:Fur family ferric uptake transcriptional regulator
MGQAVSDWAASAGEALREGGYRRGGARRAVVELLADQHCCLTAQEIHDRLRATRRGVGIASVYRVLEQLVQLELVQRVEIGDGMTRYEPVHPDGVHHHHHVVCDDCGKVEAFSDDALERAIDSTAGRLGYEARHEVVLHGACADCRS